MSPPGASVLKDAPPVMDEPIRSVTPAASGIVPDFRASVPPLARPSGSELGRPATPALGLGVASVAVITGAALCLVAAAYSLARWGSPFAMPLYWLGIAEIVAPIVVYLASSSPRRRDRLMAVALLYLALFAVKALQNPLELTYFDELLHWRTALDIIESGRLFEENSLLPASPLFPGLEIVTSALVNLGEIPLHLAGLIVVGAARVLFALSLFLLFELASRSARVAGVAVALYAGNPNFVYFGSQFAYESLALPLAAFALYLTARTAQERFANPRLWIALIGTLACVTVTHHVTSYVLLLFLIFWSTLALVIPGAPRQRLVLVPTVLLAGFVVFWAAMVATTTPEYVAAPVTRGVQDLARLVGGEAPPRELFRSASGESAPLFDQALGYLSVLLVVLGIPVGAWTLWRRESPDALRLALTAPALAYPVTLVLRFVSVGSELASRTVAFLYVGIAFVLAVGLVWGPWRRWARGGGKAVTAGWVVAIIAGGIVVGWPNWGRLPGPYLVSADTRSIEAEGRAAAEWTRETLGPHNRLAADRINRLLQTAYGDQRIVHGLADGVELAPVFQSEEFGAREIELLRRGRVRYLLVDRRLSTALPVLGMYFDPTEPGAFGYVQPISRTALDKLDGLFGIDKIYDSGNIAIYDLQLVTGG
ncbi:MAG: hypothetical protein KatS3mg060_2803 [Dehalococcoidia bacterium]|nr:MAG: hypothetical protein KatS3mg060_2803 [Dehalococcoidia bacterium]